VRYNIRYLLMTDYVPSVELSEGLLEFRRFIGPHRLYRVRHLGNFFISGSGRVQASLNTIEVTEAKPAPGTESLSLRFHYLKTLGCRPSCEVSQEAIPHDPVGFIRVSGRPILPNAFTIENNY
jgi:hypothetical protein